MDVEEKQRFEQFRSWHDEAHLYINQAITQEKPDIARSDVALMMYQRGLGLLDLALCVDCENGAGPTWEKARKMQVKMSKTRSHVESRIFELTNILAPPQGEPQTKAPPRPQAPTQAAKSAAPSRPPPPEKVNKPLRPTKPEAPPSYEVAMSENPQSAPPPYTKSSTSAPYLNVQAELDEIGEEIIDLTECESESAVAMKRSGTADSVGSSEGEILFRMEGVQVFHVSASGEVSTPSYPETLHLIKFDREANRHGTQLPPAFIEVGDWTYPLVRGKSPILKAQYGGYMFPDLDSDITGGAVGILIPDTVTDTDREIFDSLLAEITTAFKTQEEVEAEYAEYKEFSSTLATGLVKGAEVVGRGMVKGAVKTSEYLFHGSEYAKQYITPEATARQVDPKLRQGLEAARWVSTGACRVSGWMVSRVGSATMALGRLAAPHLERGATRALTSLTSQSNTEASSQIAIAGEIASGTVAAVSTMYMALENSSKILAKNIANNTVMIVSHKYGTDMAAVTDDALAAAGNSYLAFYNAGALGPKGIAKRAVKDTAKAAIGVDQAEVDRRARVAPDQEQGIRDIMEVVEGGEASKKKG
eukprot:GFUD01044118.1.p1 GENE.GFUD01044118.1~~GFUD01044118.1.p1  ORF type:complete len:589 (-),score=207.51 GFUD01044118.1:128-1894(-)